jgi:hypothetical protein
MYVRGRLQDTPTLFAARFALLGRLAFILCPIAACGRGAARAGLQPASPTAASTATGVPDTAGATRIRFARGTTSGILNDSLGAGQTKCYLIEAFQGQVMLAHGIAWPAPGSRATPPETSVRVQEVAIGRELGARGGPGPLWFGRLPSSGEYLVRVAVAAPTAYTLAVQIPRRVLLQDDQPATFSGVAPSRAPIDYLVRGESGRTLEVDLRGAPATHLHIYGLDDGLQLAPLPERLRFYGGRLETTEDYIVSVVPAEPRSAYQVTITVK